MRTRKVYTEIIEEAKLEGYNGKLVKWFCPICEQPVLLVWSKKDPDKYMYCKCGAWVGPTGRPNNADQWYEAILENHQLMLDHIERKALWNN